MSSDSIPGLPPLHSRKLKGLRIMCCSQMEGLKLQWWWWGLHWISGGLLRLSLLTP